MAFEMTFLDGTNIRAHHKATGAQKKEASSEERDHREALGRSRGGYGTKVCVIADGHGKVFGFALAPGQAHELLLAPAMLDSLPAIPLWVVADQGARPAIPAKRRDGSVACPKWAYRCRHFVENLWACLKGWRAVATRYEKNSNVVSRGHPHRCRSRLYQALTGPKSSTSIDHSISSLPFVDQPEFSVDRSTIPFT